MSFEPKVGMTCVDGEGKIVGPLAWSGSTPYDFPFFAEGRIGRWDIRGRSAPSNAEQNVMRVPDLVGEAVAKTFEPKVDGEVAVSPITGIDIENALRSLLKESYFYLQDGDDEDKALSPATGGHKIIDGSVDLDRLAELLETRFSKKECSI